MREKQKNVVWTLRNKSHFWRANRQKWAPLFGVRIVKKWALLLACERPNVARVSAGFLLQWNEPHFWLWVLIDRQINVTTFVTRIIVSSRLYLLLLYARTARTLNARSNYQKIRKKGRSARKKKRFSIFIVSTTIVFLPSSSSSLSSSTSSS